MQVRKGMVIRMKKIGILGGTFNPVHNAHIRVAEEALKQFSLDKIWFMPAGAPPHKLNEELVSAGHRCNMILAAIQGNETFELFDYEVKKDSLSYTAHTMSELRTIYPDVDFYFIIGGDSLLKFEKWREPERIVQLSNLLACGRAGEDNVAVQEKINELNAKWSCNIRYFEVPMMEIASKEIRASFATFDAVKPQSEVSEMVPQIVYDYICTNRLYGAGNNMQSQEDIISKLSSLLSPHRFRHVLGVANLAAGIAMAHGRVDINTFLYAGLLHDCAKYMKYDEMLAFAKEHELDVTPYLGEMSFQLHAVLGEYIARTVYGVSDSDILNAIRYHTVGHLNMSFLEKCIFLADYLEPSRDFSAKPTLAQMRQMAFADVDKTLYYVMKNKLAHIKSCGTTLDATTEQVFEECRTNLIRRGVSVE